VQIVKYPHPILTYESKPLRKIDQALRDMVREMFDLMYEADGVGLAANQVELPYQLLVMNSTADPAQTEEEYVFINPVITKRGGEQKIIEEGCLSFPDLHLEIVRPEMVEFQAIDLSGKVVRYKWKGMKARIIQHETDHLHGRCFYERASQSGELKSRDILAALAEDFEFDRERGFVPSDEEIKARIEKWEKERT